jgi:hypothetical protein
MTIDITCTFDGEGRVTGSTYWESDICKNSRFYMTVINNVYSLLIPGTCRNLFKEIQGSFSVVISRGTYKEKDDCFEIMFDDLSDQPYMIILEAEQMFPYPSHESTGWKGELHIHCGGAGDLTIFRNVYYRIVETLPCMRSPEESFNWGEPALKIDKREHFEAHGDRWRAFGLTDEAILHEIIQPSLEKGKLIEESIYEFPETHDRILPLVYPEKNAIRVCSLVHSHDGKNVIGSCFPLFQGIKTEAVIASTYTWENGYEGEVEIDNAEGVPISFFAPFYAREFLDLKPGEKTGVYLAGLAYSCQKAQMEFSVDKGAFYEEQLKKFLQENPGEKKTDFPDPVISMDGLVMLFPTDTYSVFEYRATILSLKYEQFMGTTVARAKICIKRDEGKELIHIHLYIPENIYGNLNLEVGMDIQGTLDLAGYR